MNYKLSFKLPNLRWPRTEFYANKAAAEASYAVFAKDGAVDFKLEELSWTDVTPSAWKEQDATKS